MITRELEENINAVRIDARRRGLEKMTVEHLTLILIKENDSVRRMLTDCSADINGLKEKLKQFLASNVSTSKNYGDEPRPTDGFKRVLQRALAQNKSDITGLHVLAAIFAEPESYAAYYMQKYGIERLTLLAQLTQTRDRAVTYTRRGARTGSDLVARAAAGKLDRPSSREAEVSLLMRALSCRYRNNALLVGAPGVGKTAVVHALAYRIADGGAPGSMANMRVLPVSVAELVAGTKYRGDFEQRIQQLVEKCRAHGNSVIFIDEIHTLIGAGAVSGSALDGANILKPLLEESEVRYIGATTQAEYRRIFEKDQALARRFKKIDIREPDEATLAAIMEKAVERLGAHHGAAYAGDAAAAAIAASRRYLPARCLPDKAIALLDEAGACRQLAPQEAPIGAEEIEQLARQSAQLPARRAGADSRLQHLQQHLSDAVLQQEEAARRLARAVLCSRFDYQDENRVVGAFLFYGPTGVGKTEMAKQLARRLEQPLLRYDMSEYMEQHAVSRLIGAPPGYVGFEQSGRLIEEVTQHPSSVVLLDEIEKAHPDVLNILLQILDYGTLTDSSGRQTSFKSATLILTSNLGSGEMERPPTGFAREDGGAAGAEAVRRFLSPEMRNRMDTLIRFQPLAPETIARIVDNKLAELAARIALKKSIHIAVSAALRRQLKQEGYSPSMGARPLQRLIKEWVLEPLAIAEADGRLAAGSRCRIDCGGAIRPQRQRSPARRKKVAVTA